MRIDKIALVDRGIRLDSFGPWDHCGEEVERQLSRAKGSADVLERDPRTLEGVDQPDPVDVVNPLGIEL